MKRIQSAAAILTCATFLYGCNPIADSRIQGNVPSSKDFDALLRRDLEKYFKEGRAGAVTVDYELLRDWPTQTGIAFPKYYAWVRMREAGKEPIEGAVRLAAMGKVQFEVTNFVEAEAIRRSSSVIDSIFPAALCASIRTKAGIK